MLIVLFILIALIYNYLPLIFSLDYLTAAVTRKTPILAFHCLPVARHHALATISQQFRPLPLLPSVGLTMLSCPLFLPPPALSQPVREKQGRVRGGSTANGRRRGTQAASGRLSCPGRALAWDRTKGYAQRKKLRKSGLSLSACR